MSSLSSYLPERIHKRTLVVIGCVLLVLALLVTAILWSARNYLTPDNASTFIVPSDSNSKYISGLGVNLLTLPSANLIRNGAFDQPLLQTQYLVNGGSEDRFSVTATDSIGNLPLTDDYFKGANIHIFRSSNEGMQKLHSATVSNYEIGRLLNRTAIDLTDDVKEVQWFDFAESEEMAERVVVAGSDGTLLSFDKNNEIKVIKSGHEDDITSIVYGSDGFLAVDLGGRFYMSDDGLNFTELDLVGSGPLYDVAYRADAGGDSGFYLVAGQAGQLYLGRGREFEEVNLTLGESLNALVVPEEGIMYVLGRNGSALYSHNGIDWQQDESLALEGDWLCGDVTEDVMFIAGSDGLMAVKRGDDEFEILDRDRLLPILRLSHDETIAPGMLTEIEWPDLQETSLFSSEHIIVIDETGIAYQSLNQGDDWELVGNSEDSLAAMTNMERLPSGRVFIAKEDGNIDWATFSSVFTFSPALDSTNVMSGDYVTVDLSTVVALNTAQLPELYPEVDVQSGEWLVSGKAAAAIVPVSESGYVEESDDTLLKRRPRGSVLRIEQAQEEAEVSYQEADARLDKQNLFSLRRKALIGEQLLNPMRPYLDVRLVQQIDTENLIRAVEPSVFPLEFDICLEGDMQGPLEIWLSGSNFEVYKEIEVKKGWQHINTVLLLPRALNPQDEVFLNIGFAGDARIYLDNIFMGRTDEEPDNISSLVKNLAAVSPEFPVLRLDCVPIGKPGFSPFSWVLPEGETSYHLANSKGLSERHNLGAVLQLAEEVNASPWLVLDARAGEEEIDKLLEYLAGSPLSTYGRIRANEGVLGRWTDAFDLVYIELVDSADSFPSDGLKAQRVNWAVEQCQKSAIYPEIANKLVFIDGMEYEDGSLRTNVDFHASALHSDQEMLNSESELEAFLSEWQQSLPRRTIIGSSFRPELISSLHHGDALSTPMRVADVAALSLAALESDNELVLLDANMLNQTYYEGNNAQISLLELAESLQGARVLDRAEREPLLDAGSELPGQEGTADSSLLLFSFKNEQTYLFVAVNLGENAEQLTLRGLPELETITQKGYDHQGRLIREEEQKRIRTSFSVMPGGFLVLELVTAD
ncbi:MAG: hypothetical protein PHZ16_02295 [Eubacteriales bacterium]|nr:hypothetical protein [Eubacteriales bacterium]